MFAIKLIIIFAWLFLDKYSDAHPTCEAIYKLSLKENEIKANFHLTVSIMKLGSGLEFDIIYIFNDFPITEQDVPHLRLVEKEFYFGDIGSKDNYLQLFYEVNFGKRLANVGKIFIRYATETVVVCENVEELNLGKVHVKATESFPKESTKSHNISDFDEESTILKCEIRDYLVARYCTIENATVGDQTNIIIENDTPANQIDVLQIYGEIHKLTSAFCEKLPHIMGFEASRLSLRSIAENAFHKCTKLKIINLIGNKLTYISPLVFEKCNKLQILNLQHNPLQSVMNSHYFKFLLNLNILSLEGNRLYHSDFNVTEFPVMRYLWHLDLRGFKHKGAKDGNTSDYYYSIPVIDREMFLKKFPRLGKLDLVEDDFKGEELNGIKEFFNNHSVACCSSNMHFSGGI